MQDDSSGDDVQSHQDRVEERQRDKSQDRRTAKRPKFCDGCRVHDEGGAGGGDEDMQEPEDDDDDSEEDEEGVEEEGLPSSSEDDEDHLVQLLLHGKRTSTPNTRFFNDNFA